MSKSERIKIGNLFFLLAVMFLILAIICYLIPERNPFWTFYPLRQYVFPLIVCFLACLIIGGYLDAIGY